MQPSFWAQELEHDFDQAIGPAFQGCLNPVKFKHKPHNSVRPISELDDPSVEGFRTACGTDWIMPEKARHWRHAYFEEGIITALVVIEVGVSM